MLSKAITVMVIISFVTVSVFGFFMMHRFLENNTLSCIALPAAASSNCDNIDFQSFVSSHLRTFQNLTTASGIWLAFLVLSLIGLLFSLKPVAGLLKPAPRRSFLKSPPQLTEFERKTIHWLSLHENSPNF